MPTNRIYLCIAHMSEAGLEQNTSKRHSTPTWWDCFEKA